MFLPFHAEYDRHHETTTNRKSVKILAVYQQHYSNTYQFTSQQNNIVTHEMIREGGMIFSGEVEHL